MRVLALILTMASGPAVGDTSVPLSEMECHRIFEDPHARVARVRSAALVVSDVEGCSADSSDCRLATLPAGTIVLVGKSQAGLSCVWAQTKDEDVDGLVHSDQIGPAAEGSRGWQGVWKHFDDVIRVSKRGAQLYAEGNAVWHGYGTNTHEGSFRGSGTPEANLLHIKDRDTDLCAVNLRLVGPFLLATDTGHCGGVNVSFNGVYTRQR